MTTIPDTVLVALITFASGFVGALFGYLTAGMSAKKQAERETRSLVFNARFSAYKDFLEALEHWAITPETPEAKALLFRKASEAVLLASDQTGEYLDNVQSYVLVYSNKTTAEARKQFLSDKSALLSAMRKDLSAAEVTLI